MEIYLNVPFPNPFQQLVPSATLCSLMIKSNLDSIPTFVSHPETFACHSPCM